MALAPRLVVGKLTVRAPKYPSETGFVESINEQLRELEEILKSVISQVENASPEIMIYALEPTFTKTQYYCPKDTHALVNSGYLEITSSRGNPRVELGYAKGGRPPYAAYVHERLDIMHKHPTRAKWVQSAMFEDLIQIQDRLRSAYGDFFSVSG